MLFRSAVEFCFPNQSAEKSNDTTAEDERGKWDFKKIDRDESEHSQRPHDFVLKRFLADTNDRRQHDRSHGRFESIKNRCDPRDVAVGGVDETQRPKNKNRRYDKKRPGDDTAPRFVKKPADVDG